MARGRRRTRRRGPGAAPSGRSRSSRRRRRRPHSRPRPRDPRPGGGRGRSPPRDRARGRRRAPAGRRRPAGSPCRCRRRRPRRARVPRRGARRPGRSSRTAGRRPRPPRAGSRSWGTPVTAAISRWSEAAWRPERDSATSEATSGGVSISSGSAGRPAHRDDHDVPLACEQTRQMPGDGGLADALARADHRDGRQLERLVAGGSKRKSAPMYAIPAASARDAQRRRSAREMTGSSERSTSASAPCEALDERHTEALTVAQLLRPAGEDRAHPLVRQLPERLPDHVGACSPSISATASSHSSAAAVTSPSMRLVYFSYSSVSRSNWMIFSDPWNG